METEKHRDKRAPGKLIIILLLLAASVFLSVTLIKTREEIKALSEECTQAEIRKEEVKEEIVRLQKEQEETKKEIGIEKDLDTETQNLKEAFHQGEIELERRVLNGETDLKIAYLTFDDGPYLLTESYLDVLKEYGVLGTFFQLGKEDPIYDEIYRRMRDEGHTMANHTYSHQIHNGIYQSADTFIDDVLKNRRFMENKTGVTTNILRFPGGSSQARELKPEIVERLRSLGYGYVDWNLESGDGKWIYGEADEYRDAVLNNTNDRKILVVLLHDYCKGTLGALPEIIEGLRAQGYVLLPLFYESAMVSK